jgi:hypothetical protein
MTRMKETLVLALLAAGAATGAAAQSLPPKDAAWARPPSPA